MKKLAIIVFVLAMLSIGIAYGLSEPIDIVTDSASYSPGDTVTATATVTTMTAP